MRSLASPKRSRSATIRARRFVWAVRPLAAGEPHVGHHEPNALAITSQSKMNQLPSHGRVACTRCFSGTPVEFDRTRLERGEWRITSNPLAWGSAEPEVIVLGFSKGPTQAGALASTAHDQIAYKGSRKNVGKILAHVGLIPSATQDDLTDAVDRLIADRSGRFHFASLVRCTVERFDVKSQVWKGSGGGMLDRFLESELGRIVTHNCGTQFLRDLPASVRLIIMFGLGSRLNYVDSALSAYQKARPGPWRKVNKVAYTDGRVTVVHVEHFASQGALVPNWLGVGNHTRAEFGRLAQQAVSAALG